MIRKSFIFLEKISSKTENNIWSDNIYSWDSFLKQEKIKGISRQRKSYYDRQIIKARNALYNFDSSFFTNRLPLSEIWRLYDFFRDEAVFLDIEASPHDGDITVVGLFDGFETKTYIKGVNLNQDVLKKELSRYKLLVTFNGLSFDIPMLKRKFNDIIPDVPHFDLRFACKRAGLEGGLKMIEKNLGIKRCKEAELMNSYDAVYLWNSWQKGYNEALDILIKYNEEDVINLKPIADFVYRRLTVLTTGSPKRFDATKPSKSLSKVIIPSSETPIPK